MKCSNCGEEFYRQYHAGGLCINCGKGPEFEHNGCLVKKGEDNMEPTAIRFDIEKELRAIEAGECGACRIGTTHLVNNPCCHKGKYAPMKHCPDCNYMWNSAWFNCCPVCEGD